LRTRKTQKHGAMPLAPNNAALERAEINPQGAMPPLSLRLRLRAGLAPPWKPKVSPAMRFPLPLSASGESVGKEFYFFKIWASEARQPVGKPREGSLFVTCVHVDNGFIVIHMYTCYE
jgi:hypothetical protein